MTTRILPLALIALLFLPVVQSATAADGERVIDFRGQWKFHIGDNERWSEPDFNDRDWPSIFVPSNWENEGYPGYDGYAWYRVRFTVSEEYKNHSFTLDAGRIDDADAVYLNGELIGFTGSFPPHYKTAYHETREYSIPRNLLNFGEENVLAIRVYDEKLSGGILEGKPALYARENPFLLLDLSGVWSLRMGDNAEWQSPEYDHDHWEKVMVPAMWEEFGFNYDGFAWYRKEFYLSASVPKDSLFLLLGRIDDFDETFFNGYKIGQTGIMPPEYQAYTDEQSWEQFRAYPIPAEAVNAGGNNTVSVRVFDDRIDGGIYEGPVGILDAKNLPASFTNQMVEHGNKPVEPKSNWDIFFEISKKVLQYLF